MNRRVIYFQGRKYTRRVSAGIESNRPVRTMLVHRWGPPGMGWNLKLISERSHYGTPFRAAPDNAGCYVDGHWGIYAVAHMVNRAEEWGYGADGDAAEIISLADRHIADMSLRGQDPLSEDEYWALQESSGEVENWLNENIAPEGYYFDWRDGEFFLQSEEWWEE